MTTRLKIQERVKNDVLETGTDTDTFIHLEDSAMAEYQELSVDGVCEQTTTKGNQLSHGTLTLVPLKNVVLSDDCIFTFNADTNAPYELNFSGKKLSEVLVLPSDVSTIYITCRLLSGTCTANYQLRIKGVDGSNKGNYSLNGSVASVNVSDIDINNDRLQVYFYGTDKTISNNAKFQIIISKDSNCELEPYTGGQPSPNPDYPQEIKTITGNLKLTSCGKNLFDKDNSTSGYRLGSTGDLYRENGYNTSDFVRVKSNTQYFRNVTISQMECVCTYNEKKEFIERLQSGKSITTNNEANYIRIVSKDENLDIMQVEEGTQATPYEQHLETQITANLPEGEFIGKINDTFKDTLKVVYKDDGHYHLILNKKVGKVVLNGSEYISKNSIINTGFMIMYNQNSPFYNKIKIGTGLGVSNYFINQGNTSTWTGKGKFGFNTAGVFWVMHTDDTINTIDKFKTWLSTHNTEVYYALETPYTLDLGVIDMPLSYNEVTNIFTDSDLLPTINAKYYRNFISTVRNLQVNEKALKQELIDINNRLSALENANVVDNNPTEESEATNDIQVQ